MTTETAFPDWMTGFKPTPQRPRRTAEERAEQAAAKAARAAEREAEGVHYPPSAVPGVQGFAKGLSGNPRGRPKGSRDKRTVLLEQLSDAGQEITQLVIDKAREGDLSAAALVLARIAPPLKARAQTVTFTLDSEASLLEQACSVLAAVAEGILDPDSGRTLISCISTMSDLKVSELTERLAAIEEKLTLRGLR